MSYEQKVKDYWNKEMSWIQDLKVHKPWHRNNPNCAGIRIDKYNDFVDEFFDDYLRRTQDDIEYALKFMKEFWLWNGEKEEECCRKSLVLRSYVATERREYQGFIQTLTVRDIDHDYRIPFKYHDEYSFGHMFEQRGGLLLEQFKQWRKAYQFFDESRDDADMYLEHPEHEYWF